MRKRTWKNVFAKAKDAWSRFTGLADPVSRKLVGFTEEVVYPGSSFALKADVQHGFALRRFVMTATFVDSGSDAAGYVRVEDVKVGTRSQLASYGALSLGLFDPKGRDPDVTFESSGRGQDVWIKGSLNARAPGPVLISAAGVGVEVEP